MTTLAVAKTVALLWVLLTAFPLVDCVLLDNIPPNGFVAANTKIGKETYRVISRIDAPSICTELAVTIPTPYENYGGKYSLEPRPYNLRPAWRFEDKYVSFVNNQGEGTWLIGDKPGVDAGIAYARHNYPTLIPPSKEYYILASAGGWQSAPEIEVQCTGVKVGKSFFMLETGKGDVTILVPKLAEAGSCKEKKMRKSHFGQLTSGETSFPHLPFLCSASIFDKHFQTWTKFEVLQDIEPLWFGGALVSDPTKSPKPLVIVSAEFIYEIGWRLTCIDPNDTTRNVYPILSTNGELTLPDEYNEAYKREINAEYERESGKTGANNFIPKVLSKTDSKLSEIGRTLLSNMKLRQWVWVFAYPPLPDTNDVPKAYASVTIEPKGMVLQLVAREKHKLVFQWHSTDRGRVLHRRALDAVVSTITVDLEEEKFTMTVFGRNNSNGVVMDILSAIPLGTTAIEYIRQYLGMHEGMYGISSCFMYHSGTSLPEPFVYAAEIACVLSGAKPIGMIQFTSPSDDETVYPLVRELCEHIVAFKALHGEAFPIDWKVFKYTYPETGADHETLIIYRSNRKDLVRALRPEGEVAQALHILPFPRNSNENDRIEDLKEQLFLSYWNGKVLGYPDNMIEVYIREFKSDLAANLRAEQIIKARDAVTIFFKESNISPITIKNGLDVPVTESFWESLPSVVENKATEPCPEEVCDECEIEY